jgi:hypothetical protein
VADLAEVWHGYARTTADPAVVPGVVRFAHRMLDLSPATTDLPHALTIARQQLSRTLRNTAQSCR